MNFTAKEVVSIIKAIGQSGISHFECGDLKIESGPQTEVTVKPVEEPFRLEPYIEPPTPAPQEPVVDQFEELQRMIRETIDTDADLQEMERQNLMISDPAEFEKMMDREGMDDARESATTEDQRAKYAFPTRR